MKRSILFLGLLVLLVIGAFGCANEADSAPATLATRASELARAKGCAVTDADVAAVKFGDYPEDTVEAARQELWEATKGVEAVDNRLKENLARVGPALSEKKIAAFVDAFERIGTVDGKKVSDVRARYSAATKNLATVLEAIDADDFIAQNAAVQNLIAAYGELAKSPCSARAVRFGVILLMLPETPSSPYKSLEKYEATAHGIALIHDGLAGGVVEEAIAANDPDKGLAAIRTWVGAGSSYTGSLSSLLANRDALRAQLKPGSGPGAAAIIIQNTDLTQPLRVLNGVLSIWNLSEAVAERDVVALLQTGPSGVECVASAVGALGRHFEWARVSNAANVANVASKVGLYVGAVFTAKSIVDVLATLGEPNTDTHAALVELGGHALVLVGAFVPPPLGIALAFGGSMAILVSRWLRDPPPDELSPLLQDLVDKKLLGANEKSGLAKARADNMFVLRKNLALTEDEVLWTVVRAPTAVAKEDALDYLEVLGKLAKQKGKTPINLLKAVGKSSDVEWARFELETFFGYVQPGPALFRSEDAKLIKADLTHLKTVFVTGFFSPKDAKRADGKDVGTAEQLASHARGAIQGAIDSIP